MWYKFAMFVLHILITSTLANNTIPNCTLLISKKHLALLIGLFEWIFQQQSCLNARWSTYTHFIPFLCIWFWYHFFLILDVYHLKFHRWIFSFLCMLMAWWFFQTQLLVLSDQLTCSTWTFLINVGKSTIVVFRKREE